jgi:hypothetical protein
VQLSTAGGQRPDVAELQDLPGLAGREEARELPAGTYDWLTKGL